MEYCELIYCGEAPDERPATPKEQPISVTELVIEGDRWSPTMVSLAALEAVTHGVSQKTLTLKVSFDPSKHKTFTICCFKVGPASQTVNQHKISIG